MRDVAIVGTAQSVHARRVDDRNEVEMLMPVLQELKDGLGVTQADLGFTSTASGPTRRSASPTSRPTGPGRSMRPG